MNLKSRYPGAESRGFTFIELLTVITVLLLLSTLMLPVLAKAHQSPQATQCLNNHRQIMLAALMYADDNGGTWFPNQPGTGTQREWVGTLLDFSNTNPNNTNAALFLSPANNFFAKYISTPTIFHCPADQSFVPGLGQRVRSVSASQAVGTQWQGVCNHPAGDPVTGQWLTGVNTDCDATWRRYGKISDMVNPSPAGLWVFADEHCNSINDSGMAVECSLITIGAAKWIDLPANYHNGAAGFSFADGHAELHKWIGSLATFSDAWTGVGAGFPNVATSSDLSDIRWIQVRTSALN